MAHPVVTPALVTVLQGRDSAIVTRQPGAGVITALTDKCKELGLSHRYYTAAYTTPEELFAEFVGHPWPVDGKLTFVPDVNRVDHDVVIFDDLDRATPEVQALVKELVEHNRLGVHDLPVRRAFVACTSSPEFAAENAAVFTASV